MGAGTDDFHYLRRKTGICGQFYDITERKLAEDKLEQAAQEWRTTFDSITDITYYSR